VSSNSVTRRVAQKEVQLFFSSPVAWMLLASFAVATLFIFFWVESFFARNIADIRPLFEWMPILLIFLCSALTMRMWSEERYSGTLEHMLTLPVSLWHFVMGKFWACFILLLMALISTLPLALTVALIGSLDWGPVIGGYVATVLLGTTYLAIGLCVSALTDNAIVSMIGTVVICVLLYLLGSTTFTGFFDDRTGEMLRLLSSGARFESITRGIIDLRDLFYYVSLSAAFLVLNVYVLESKRWAKQISTARHRHWRAVTGLLLGNLLLANIWLGYLSPLRLDTTENKLFSISPTTENFLDELQEPLLIRGYFSSKTHPLLAPLIPQLRDLLREYELLGKGKVKIEFIDPAEHPELEQEANERYGISATPFQTTDRHQSSLVNAYFNLLVSYGTEHQSLGFADLIEVRTAPTAAAEVMLRNPEYDITNAIKKVLSDYRSGDNLFEGIDEPVEFIGYVSADALLPEQLLAYKNAIIPQLALAAQNSKGKFSVRFIEPEAREGAVAAQIEERWGFKPMVASMDDSRKFFFYLTLADSKQVVQLPTDKFNPSAFRLILDTGLKRFAPGLTRIVALSLPDVDPAMAQYKLGAPTFDNLQRAVSRNYSIRLEELSDGAVTPEADILAVVAPHQLDERSVYAIDQFLMRGGTVILATSPYSTELADGQLRLLDWDSGLQQWLAHNGVEIEETLVLDTQNASFPAPVSRKSGDHEFRDVQMIDYPYFIDLRPTGLASDHAVTGNLPQITMAWASPIVVKPGADTAATVLLKSSAEAWLSNSRTITPSIDAKGRGNFKPPAPDDSAASATPLVGARNLGVALQGRFKSFFADRDNPLDIPPVTGALQRSPESARIVLYSSNDFMDDQILKSIVTASGTQYLGSLELFLNTLDWALQDEQLTEIRSHAHFNRTLPPMERTAQLLLEYFNYGIALLWLILVGLASWLQFILRRRHYARRLKL
jgi:ABC-2 type transport system permease protein